MDEQAAVRVRKQTQPWSDLGDRYVAVYYNTLSRFLYF